MYTNRQREREVCVCVCVYVYIYIYTHTFIANINTCRKYIRDSKFKRHKHRSPRAGLGLGSLGTLHQLLKPPKKEATPEVTSMCSWNLVNRLRLMMWVI